MTSVKVTAVGNALGVVLPKDMLAKLGIGKGDRLFVTETATGIRLSTHDPEFTEQMEAAEIIMRKHRDVLGKLANS